MTTIMPGWPSKTLPCAPLSPPVPFEATPVAGFPGEDLGKAPLLLVAGWLAGLLAGGVHTGELGCISLAVPLSLA